VTLGKNEPDISVVLCTYNGEAFIQEQLESILAQSLPPNEIVISDDGSSDQTLARIKAIQDSSTASIRWVVITRDKPFGPAENFAHALTVATGELIALSDQDDIWESTKLAVLRSHFQKHPDALLVHTNARLIDSAGREGKNSDGHPPAHGIGAKGADLGAGAPSVVAEKPCDRRNGHAFSNASRDGAPSSCRLGSRRMVGSYRRPSGRTDL